jgi:hypothetical protein
MYVYGSSGSKQGYFLEPPLGGDETHPKGSIPAGDYEGEFREHLATHTRVLSLFIFKGVPGFTGIYSHNGNVPADSAGCLLYGNALGKCDRVTGSSLFRASVMDFLGKSARDANKSIHHLTIDIRVMDGFWDTPPRPKDGLTPDIGSTITYGGEAPGGGLPRPLSAPGSSAEGGVFPCETPSKCPN